MDLGTELPVLQSMNDSENKSNSNGVYHVEDKNGKLVDVIQPAVTETLSKTRSVLKKWRRIPRELVKKDSNINGDVNNNGNSTVATREDSDQSSRSSTAASIPRIRNEINGLNGRNQVVIVSDYDQRRNGRFEPGKKARGFQIEKENSVESDSRSTNFLFVQGINTVASKSGGGFVSYDEDYSDDANYGDIHYNEEGEERIEFLKGDDESEDIASEKHEDVLVESIKGLDLAQKEFEKEVQKWRDVGKDDSFILDSSINDMLEIKDAKILELESTLISGDTELEDLLKKIIQAEVEYVVITTTTKTLTAGPLSEIKHNLQQKNVSSQDTLGPKKQVAKLEAREDVKNLQKRLCKFVTRFMIQLILLLVILYLKFVPRNVEVVPT
ncbi:WPP domain-interacting protein 2-like [Rutidosis leptorrhynchoides]|uniref:WPP domain-interacting protein 2-like n=1 Tax=Rutidosis leptorrhynchoides TaxID=125765 RepID=UPI003A98E260